MPVAFVPCSHLEDRGLEIPNGKTDGAFLETIRIIEEKIMDLKNRLTRRYARFLC